MKKPKISMQKAKRLYGLSKDLAGVPAPCPYLKSMVKPDPKRALRVHNQAVAMIMQVNSAKKKRRNLQAHVEEAKHQQQPRLTTGPRQNRRQLKPLPASTRTPSPDVTWCLRCNRTTPCTHHPERP